MTEHITADIHFQHRNILKYCPARRNHRELPPDGSPEYDQMVDEMNETIITNWNSKVDPDDTVWVLGDVAMGLMSKAPPLIRSLNGKKILIAGNHDSTLIRNTKRGDPDFQGLFDSIHSSYFEYIYKTVDGKKVMIVMSHYPIAFWNGSDSDTWKSSIHFYGHLHCSNGIKHIHAGATMDVCIDGNNLSPYNLDEAIQMARSHANVNPAKGRHS